MRVTVILIIVAVLLSSCASPVESGSWWGNWATTSRDVSNPDMFLLGQSNATGTLAMEIERATGLAVAQINHGGNSVEAWLTLPYSWAVVDKEFIRGRTVDYIVWFQGESNRLYSENYGQKVEQALTAMYPDNANTTVIIIQVASPTVDLSEVRQKQAQVVAQHDNWVLVDSRGLERSDSFHLTEEGRMALAEHIETVLRNLK